MITDPGVVRAVLVAAGGAAWEAEAVTTIESSPDLRLGRRCVDVLELVAAAASGQAGIALIALDLDGLDTDAVLRLRDSGVTSVAVVGSADQHDRAAALGLDASLSLDELGSLGDVLGDVSGATVPDSPADLVDVDAGFGSGRPRARGRLVTVWGPHGAPGRTTVATALAACTARRGTPTLLVDADTYGGTVAQSLGVLDEVSGLLAAARSANGGHLDLPELTRHVRQLAPSLRVLTGPARADQWTRLRTGSFASVLDVACTMAPLVVVDVAASLEVDEDLVFDTAAPRRNGVARHALEAADDVIVVGAPDPVGLARLARGLHELGDAVPGARTHVVLNRMRGSLGWSEDEVGSLVERFTRRRPIAYLPDDVAAVDRCLVRGGTLVEHAPDAALTRAVDTLAAGLVGGPTRRGLRGRLGRRGGTPVR